MVPEVFLRSWKREDARQLAFIANNKNIWNNLRDSIPYPYSISDAEQWIAHCSRQKPLLNFAIIYDNLLVGSIGCTAKTDVYRKTMEVGYFIGEPYWRHGIATSAVQILISHIEKEFDVVRLVAEVYAHNKASMNVLHKNGFYLECIRRKGAFKNDVVVDDYVWVKFLKK